MFFTQEDYRKIEKWLLTNSRKDTDFVGAATPLKGNETVVLVQNGKNVKTSVKDIVDQFFLLGVSDFLNITDKYGESYITTDQAIQLIPFRSRKIGQVITFIDEFGNWAIYQFQGKALNQWNNTTLWIDLLAKVSGIPIIDSEDITTKENSAKQVSLYLADKQYNEADYSGLGKIYLRKNIQTIIDPSTEAVINVNLLTQSMLAKENTTYIIQYDYNLNKQIISIPEGSVLLFEGGSIDDGTINCNNTTIVDKFSGNATIVGTYSFQDAQADEEDITQNQSSVLKFKDRKYEPDKYSGLGRIILRKNIIEIDDPIYGKVTKNILFQDMIAQSNTIYEVRYDFDLNGAEVIIPRGCVLKFGGGSVRNGIIDLNGCDIEADDVFVIGTTIRGTSKHRVLFANWLIEDVANITSSEMNSLANCGMSVTFTDKEYYYNGGSILLAAGTSFTSPSVNNVPKIYVTPKDEDAYIFGIYTGSEISNLSIILTEHKAVDVIRFDSSFVQNQGGSAPVFVISHVSITEGISPKPGAENLSTAIHLLVRNFNDDGSTNGNTYNILSARPILRNISCIYTNEGIKIEAIQQELSEGQAMIFMNSLLLSYIKTYCNNGIVIRTINRSSTAMHSLAYGNNISNWLAQILSFDVADYNNKALIVESIKEGTGSIERYALKGNDWILWDNSQPILANNAEICVVNYNAPQGAFANGVNAGVKMINGGVAKVVESPNQYDLRGESYDPPTGNNSQAIKAMDGGLEFRLYHARNGKDSRATIQSLPDLSVQKKIYNRSNALLEVITNSHGKKEAYLAASTGQRIFTDSYAVNDKVVTLPNNTFAFSLLSSDTIFTRGAIFESVITLNYDDLTKVNLSVISVTAGNKDVVILSSTVQNKNQIVVRYQIPNHVEMYYNLQLRLVLRNQDAYFVLPESYSSVVTLKSKTIGQTWERPASPVKGAMFFDTDLAKPLWYNGSAWVDSLGIQINIKNKGTFAEKPLASNGIPNGFAYFCTDKQTAEGAINGIMIYHKGGDVWVDALGRVVS